MNLLEEAPIKTEEDIIKSRALAREKAREMGFGVVDQTRIATAVSEIARNALLHGLGGVMRVVVSSDEKCIEIIVEDNGPGIPDIKLAMTDGYTTKKGMGYGLGGASRLMDELVIDSRVGVGTKVSMKKYLRS